MTTALVPGELRGYRRFRLADDGLHPTVHDRGPWSAGTEHAECVLGEEHAPPSRGCGCGLYGWYAPSDTSRSPGLGDVDAVIAAHGRVVLGDWGFRAASARVVAVSLPWPLRWRPRRAAEVRASLRAQYPALAVYGSRRAMVRDHPPEDLSALGIVGGASPLRRRSTIALLVWLLGVGALYTVVALPRDAVAGAGAAAVVPALALFVLWQVALVVLVGRITRR